VSLAGDLALALDPVAFAKAASLAPNCRADLLRSRGEGVAATRHLRAVERDLLRPPTYQLQNVTLICNDPLPVKRVRLKKRGDAQVGEARKPSRLSCERLPVRRRQSGRLL
jgi:hypothetical protein